MNNVFKGKTENRRTGTEVQNSLRFAQSMRPVRYAPASFSWTLEAGVDGSLFAVGTVSEVSPGGGLGRTLLTGIPRRSLLAGAMEVEAQTSSGARL